MRKFLYIYLFLFANVAFAKPHLCLFNQDEILTPQSKNVLKILGIHHDAKQSLQDIYKSLDDQYGRKPGQERWQMTKNERLQKIAPALRASLKNLGIIDEVLPPKEKDYQSLVIHGSTINSMRQKVLFLNNLIQSGLITNPETKDYYFITGDRQINSNEHIDDLSFDTLSRPGWKEEKVYKYYTQHGTFKTESDGARVAVDQLIQNPLIRNKFVFVSTPMQPILNDDGSPKIKDGAPELRRPHTGDTIQTLMREHREIINSPSLWVSAGPNIYYQNAITLRELLDAATPMDIIDIATIGPATSEATAIEVLVDAFRNTFQREMEVLEKLAAT